MTKIQRASSRGNAAQLLADAPLCVDEQYYRDMARPYLRKDAARRLRDILFYTSPALALVCLLAIAALLALTLSWSNTLIRRATPALAALTTVAWVKRAETTTLWLALSILVVLLIGSATATVWARRDRMRERRLRAALDAKAHLANAYRQYLQGLLALTEPLRWMRLPERVTADDGEERSPVIVAPALIRVEADSAPHASTPKRNVSLDSGVLPVTRYGWETSVEAARRNQPAATPVESLGQALSASHSGAILLSGGEGSGKTTLLRHVAHAQALAQLRRSRPGGRAPLYADLGWLDGAWPTQERDGVSTALALLAQRIGGLEPDLARALAQAMTQGPSLLLLDELDHLPDEQRELASAAIATCLSQRPATDERDDERSLQVVVGAREYHAPLGDGPASSRLERWSLEPLSYPLGRLALIRGALELRHRRPVTDEAAEALLRTLDTPAMELRRSQPATLALMAVAGEQEPGATPYDAHVDLIAAATTALVRARTPDWQETERQALLEIAEELALWLHIQGRRAFHPATPEVDDALRHLPAMPIITARTGDTSPSRVVASFSGLCESGPAELATFSLNALAAYLAGRALARRIARELPTPLANDSLMASAVRDGRHPALAMAWARRNSARWRDVLRAMCGALCSPTTDGIERGERRGDIARAWLDNLLAAHGRLSPRELALAAALLAEMRGDPAAEALAVELAALTHQDISASGQAPTESTKNLMRVSADVMTHPGGRATLIDLLRVQLLGDDERVAWQAARAFGALGSLGVNVTPTLLDLLRSTIWSPRAAVAHAFAAIGPTAGDEARIALLEALDDRTLAVRIAAIEALGAVAAHGDATTAEALMEQLNHPSAEVRAAAAAALGRIGADTPPIIEALMGALNDEEIPAQVAAAFALSRLPSAVEQIPTLIEALSAMGWGDRAAAALALGEMGPAAAMAVPMLLEQSHADTVMGRALAARALAQIAPQRADVVAALIERLSDEAPEPRRAAAESLALTHMATGRQAWPALLGVLRDSKESVRLAASHALDMQGGLRDAGVVASMFSLLEDSRGYVRAAAARTLGALGGAEAQSLSTRIGALGSLRDEVCLVAVDELGALGAHARSATATISRLLGDPRWETRRAALRAIRRIAAPRASASVSLAHIADPEALVRLEAIEILADIGPDDTRGAGPIIEALQRRLLSDADGSARAAAARALGRQGLRAAAALPSLLRALSESDGETQRAAALAIGDLQPNITTTLPLLTGRLSDPTPGTRAAVALALGGLGPRAAEQAAPELLILLRDEVPTTRAAAAEGLGRLGAGVSEAARDALMDHLIDLDAETRAASASALGRIGAGEELDWGALTEALLLRTHDQRYIVRRAAVEALTALGPTAARSAEERLVELLSDPDSATRVDACDALASLGVDGQIETLPSLLALLSSGSTNERAAAALALAAMRPALDTDTQERLTALLMDESSIVRAAAAQAIGALSETAFTAGAPVELVSALGDDAWQTRAAAASALGQFGERISDADRAALRATLSDPDETARQAAASTLAQGTPQQVLPLVAELLTAVKTRQASGVLMPLAQRRELEVYAAMERPNWTAARRMLGWLADGSHWTIQLNALALATRWRYAPVAARRRLRRLSERGTYPRIRASAETALTAIPNADDLPADAADIQRDLRAITISQAADESSAAPISRTA